MQRVLRPSFKKLLNRSKKFYSSYDKERDDRFFLRYFTGSIAGVLLTADMIDKYKIKNKVECTLSYELSLSVIGGFVGICTSPISILVTCIYFCYYNIKRIG